MSTTFTPRTSSSKSLKTLSLPFANDLVFAIVKDRISENTIVSPIGIQVCMALVYLGAEGDTFKEMDANLKLGEISKASLMEKYCQILAKDARGVSAKVKMGSRLFLDKDYQISNEVNTIARENLDCEMVNINLSNKMDTSVKINAWAEAHTENMVKNMIQGKNINQGTAAVLVNAMYLKAKWISIFDSTQTTLKEFFMSDEAREQVDMMYQTDQFLYGELKELNATGIELPFVDTNITMLIVLPKVKGSLPLLEEKLQYLDITKLSQNFKKTVVHFYMPKFVVEDNISLHPVLEELGMGSMFSSGSDLARLLAVEENLTIGLFKQKIFLEINENGTYGEAGTEEAKSANLKNNGEPIPELMVNHPFFFVIKDNNTVYFAGHVAKT